MKNCKIKRQYLKVWLCKATCHSDHGSGQRPRDTNSCQKFRDVGSQTEWNRAISIQVPCGIIYVETKVGDVQLACVLKAEDQK